jgi:transcriptional regulator with XRE-family HTH domain
MVKHSEKAKAIGNKIRYYRDAAHLTQQELADKLPRRTSQTLVSGWECGVKSIDATDLLVVAEVLGIKCEQLLPQAPVAEKRDPRELELCRVDCGTFWVKVVREEKTISQK